jgi:hypothetical protein
LQFLCGAGGVHDEVLAKDNLVVDVFADDLNEPDLIGRLLKLARKGRIRMILDNAALHRDAKKPAPEDQFEKPFVKAAGNKKLLQRGKFGRYSRDKVMIVCGRCDDGTAADRRPHRQGR